MFYKLNNEIYIEFWDIKIFSFYYLLNKSPGKTLNDTTTTKKNPTHTQEFSLIYASRPKVELENNQKNDITQQNE